MLFFGFRINQLGLGGSFCVFYQQDVLCFCEDLVPLRVGLAVDHFCLAVRFGRFLISSTKRLTNFPEMGRAVPEIGDPNIREIIVRSYRVIYHVHHGDCRVDVLRFWHGARGTPTIDD